MKKLKLLIAIILAASIGFVCGVVVTRESNDELVKTQEELKVKLVEAKAKIGQLSEKLTELKD